MSSVPVLIGNDLLTILSCSLDILDDVLAGGVVDERIGAELLQAHLPLLLTSINGNCPETHGLGVLLSKRSETTATADNADGLAWLRTGLLQALVDGDTSAENW